MWLASHQYFSLKAGALPSLQVEWRVTIPLPLAPQTNALPIELHSPFGGDGGYRAHSSGFSVQRNHLICHVSKLGVVRDLNPYPGFHRARCSSCDSPLTITTPYKIKKSELFWSSDFKYLYFSRIYFISPFKSRNTFSVPNWVLNHLFDLLKCLCVRFVVIVLYIKKFLSLLNYFIQN